MLPYPPTALAIVGLVIAAGTAVQTSIGFGSMVIAMTLGALVLPVGELVPLLLPVTLTQTVIVAVGDRGVIAWDLLLRRVLPIMGTGMAASLLLVTEDAPWMRPALGLMILGLAVRELWKGAPKEGQRGSRLAANVGILVAGVVHGIFATGGPPLVWALGQEQLDKRTFRTTLTVVWLVLNAVLLVTFLVNGRVDGGTAMGSAVLLLPTLLGIAAGQWLHHRVDEARFRTAVWGVLVVAALPLILR